MQIDWTVFALFNVFVMGMLALDLGVFHRKSHAVSMKEALGWSAVWITLALTFNALLWWQPGWFFSTEHVAMAIAKGELPASATMADYGSLRSSQFLAGYLIEKALSVDNIFVIVLIFSAFAVPAAYQHRVLFYGIVGALIMRGIFIFAGVALIQTFAWLLYVFGAFLILTGIKMALPQKTAPDPSKHWLVRFARRFLPCTDGYRGERFFTIENGKRMLTPLFLVVLMVEFTDLIFALDSIPAILAITDNAFIVYTSNVFAILGLRSLYFALAGLVELFHYLKYGLAAILVFVGAKMLLHLYEVPNQVLIDGVLTTQMEPFKVSIGMSLAIIGGLLASAIIASLIRARVLSRGAATAVADEPAPH